MMLVAIYHGADGDIPVAARGRHSLTIVQGLVHAIITGLKRKHVSIWRTNDDLAPVLVSTVYTDDSGQVFYEYENN